MRDNREDDYDVINQKQLEDTSDNENALRRSSRIKERTEQQVAPTPNQETEVSGTALQYQTTKETGDTVFYG